jgi:hypothetical protein
LLLNTSTPARSILALLAASCLASACARAPGSAASPGAADAACGAAGEPAPWCSGPFPGPDLPVSPLARLALIDALAAACPRETADDPTPGLSPGARAIARNAHGRRRMVAPIGLEIDALEQLLKGTPEASPEHELILDRLAESYFILERSSYEACREARVPETATQSALSVEERRVRALVDGIRRGREEAERQCAALVRLHPQHVIRASCAG